MNDKPAIHYWRTGRIGNETIFSSDKILFAKTGRTCCFTLFVVCHQFLHKHIRHWEHEGISFFQRKTPLCLSKRPLPPHKSCEQCTAKNLFTKHGECLLYTILCTSFFCHFTIVSSLFANNVQRAIEVVPCYLFERSPGALVYSDEKVV